MLNTVLVPVDGSPLAEQALPAALAICRRARARLHLVHVRSQHAAEGYALAEDPARAYVEDLASRLGADLGQPVASALLPDRAPTLLKPAPSPDTVAAMLAAYARRHVVDQFVLTTHGRSGINRLWFGSVAEALLRRSHVPLLLIRPRDDTGEEDVWSEPQPLRRILVATDGSEVSRRAVELAGTIGTLFEAEYTLLRVVPLPYEVLGGLSAVTVAYSGQDMEESVERAKAETEREAESLRAAGGTATTEVVIDPSPGRAILRYAREQAVDLVVLASHTRGSLDRFLVGSVADKVIRGGETPLLVQQAAPDALAAENEALLAGEEADEDA